MPNKVVLEYTAEGDKLISESNRVKSSLGDVEEKSKKTGSGMSTAFKVAAAGIAAAGIGGLLKGMFDEAKEAQQVSASTAQGIKTMGAEAWTSADKIGDLSTAISNKIGVDDEAIQSSANLLLTFGNVRNEAGAMNNVFDRSVAAAQDLSAKGFGSADAAAKMLGKALNDPLKGMTALAKAGVTFSQAQKDQIADMIKSGDLLGAQKILLGEVERQVGGTAEATATGADKMAVMWGNFQEQLGTEMMPILEAVLTKLMAFLDWASKHQGIVIAFAAIAAAIWLVNIALDANPIILVISLIAGLVAAFIWLWETSAGFRNFFIGIWQDITSQVGGAINWIKGAWNGMVSFFSNIISAIGRIFSGIGNAISGAFKNSLNWVIGVINHVIDFFNKIVYGINLVNPFDDIPSIPHIPKVHTGGVVPGLPGQERLMMLQGGERITANGQSGGSGGGGGTLRVTGDVKSVLYQVIQLGIRTGALRLES
jgi:hypothetical protein